ncbi:DUF4177 domain-containing protein [Paludisphaera borealis]|uniref:Zinc finger/thioredoxin putative domain-containing protein n=1 Tax=Paludisphaera borealis TaxID=1387353 RepID=A0A1U7CXA1_9BACT|nr:DUF4177 domain-containing protein [Paludisphaera borealis]APW63551.1 hypothetical protein BSF38_05123 [Paludisphaera borealis]
MLNVACPSCGERGKIPANLVGARIKCKKCGQAFHVAAAAGKPSAPAPAAAPAGPGDVAAPGPAASAHDGIAVEGLDAASWSLAPDQSSLLQAVANPERAADAHAAPAESFTVHHEGAIKEYKLLTSRDKLFEGKFDLARLEEALNHLARQGWTAKSMCLPHLKNFQGAMQEEVVVLLER